VNVEEEEEDRVGDKLHRDHQETDDLLFAAFLRYLGYRVIRVEVSSQRGAKPVFGLLVPDFDRQLIATEYTDESTALSNLPAYVKAIQEMQRLVSTAQRKGGIVSFKC
jgi:hypothetical protein